MSHHYEVVIPYMQVDHAGDDFTVEEDVMRFNSMVSAQHYAKLHAKEGAVLYMVMDDGDKAELPLE